VQAKQVAKTTADIFLATSSVPNKLATFPIFGWLLLDRVPSLPVGRQERKQTNPSLQVASEGSEGLHTRKQKMNHVFGGGKDPHDPACEGKPSII
jgi:hypothetical protein